MTTFAFLNSNFNNFEVYETGDFEDIKTATEYAKKMSDELEIDIEVWEYRITVQPFTSWADGGMNL